MARAKGSASLSRVRSPPTYARPTRSSVGARRPRIALAASICCSPITGGPPAGTALSFDDLAWQAAFALLVLSVIRTVRLVVPAMRARGGGAILVGTSSTVKEPFPNLALSNIMRAGVTSLVKTLSVELTPDQIRVNSLLPGRIATDRLKYLDEANAAKAGITAEEQRQLALATIPAGRYGDPDEFGRAGGFFCPRQRRTSRARRSRSMADC